MLTVLPCIESCLNELQVRAVAGKHNNELNFLVLEEVLRSYVMLYVREVNLAVTPFEGLQVLRRLRRWTSL